MPRAFLPTPCIFAPCLYRKPTFTGLTTKFHSAVSNLYKYNLIKCLVFRAFKICSTEAFFYKELDNIRRLLCQNNFPNKIVNDCIRVKLENIYSSGGKNFDVPRKDFYISLPYVSKLSNHNVKLEINKLIDRFYPQLKPIINFKNNFNVRSFFQFKDRVPDMLRSNIVYEFKCAHCTATYCGLTTRHLQTRVAEHMGKSPRTGRPMANLRGAIIDHTVTTGHGVSPGDFSIVHSCNNHNLDISESIIIHSKKPTLNNLMSSTPLNILS